MTAQPMTPEQIRAVGLKALAAALGPDGMVRFLLQFAAASGDYPAARQAWADQFDLVAVLRALDQQRQESVPRKGTAAEE